MAPHRDDDDDILTEPIEQPVLAPEPDLARMLGDPKSATPEEIKALSDMMRDQDRVTVAVAVVEGAISAHVLKSEGKMAHARWRRDHGIAESTDYLARRLHRRWVEESKAGVKTIPYRVGGCDIMIPESMADMPLKDAAFGPKKARPMPTKPSEESLAENEVAAWVGLRDGDVPTDKYNAKDVRLSAEALWAALQNPLVRKFDLDARALPLLLDLLEVALVACGERGKWDDLRDFAKDNILRMQWVLSLVPDNEEHEPDGLWPNEKTPYGPRPERGSRPWGETPEAARAAYERMAALWQPEPTMEEIGQEIEEALTVVLDGMEYAMTPEQVVRQVAREVDAPETRVRARLNRRKWPRWPVDKSYLMPEMWQNKHEDEQREIAAKHGWVEPKPVEPKRPKSGRIRAPRPKQHKPLPKVLDKPGNHAQIDTWLLRCLKTDQPRNVPELRALAAGLGVEVPVEQGLERLLAAEKVTKGEDGWRRVGRAPRVEVDLLAIAERPPRATRRKKSKTRPKKAGKP